MATDQECVAYARECVRLAELTDEPEIRDQLFALAREWTAAAMHVNQTSITTRHHFLSRRKGREHLTCPAMSFSLATC